MKPETREFLNMAVKPARLTLEQAAWLLGFGEHEISILIAKGLLKPLGHPASNGQKFFLTATLEDIRRDEKWFNKATDAVVEYWRGKNRRKVRSESGKERNTSESLDTEFVISAAK
jgi:hypothetical protein